MVQKEQKRARGRPRAYDPDRALAQAMGAFWDRGYAATSLDDISAATGMNRPSLYAAFGDKHAIYMKALERHYGAGTALRDALSYDEPLCDALRRAYGRALAVYLSEEHGARGCFVIGTAATEAVTDPEVRRFLGELVAGARRSCSRRAFGRRETLASCRPMPIPPLLGEDRVGHAAQPGDPVARRARAAPSWRRRPRRALH